MADLTLVAALADNRVIGRSGHGLPWSLPAARPAYDGGPAEVLLSSDADHPSVAARIAAGGGHQRPAQRHAPSAAAVPARGGAPAGQAALGRAVRIANGVRGQN